MAGSYYSKLVGKKFKGTYIGQCAIEIVLHYGSNNYYAGSWRKWYKIEVGEYLDDDMKKGLDDIEDKFKGKIWKGFHNDVLYVAQDSHNPNNWDKTKLKIENWSSFPITEETEKYTDEKGYHLYLKEV